MSDEPRFGAIDLAALPDLGDRSVEVARIWVTEGAGSTVAIDAGVLDDPFVFGVLLADTARHAARAYAAAWDINQDEALQRIVDGLGEELRGQFNDIAAVAGGRSN